MSEHAPALTGESVRIAPVTHRTAAVLPAAGAYTDVDTAAIKLDDGVIDLVFGVTYTRGGSGGQVKLKIMVTLGDFGEYPAAVVDGTITASEPFSQQAVRPAEFVGPIPASAAAVKWAIPVTIRGGITAIRLLAAEAATGNTGAPGTLGIVMSASHR